MQAYGLYVHIPFCRTKCGYCDFLSFASQSDETIRTYKNALLREIAQTTLRNPVDTIYIGGGTPTALPPVFLREIICALQRFDLAPGYEFTVECNPGTLTAEMLAMLKKNGVNRLSIGLQAWQDRLLNIIGRGHTQADFANDVKNAQSLGFDNISVDLMFGLPHQTINDWKETLTAAAGFKPAHISAYSLTAEEGVPIWAQRHHFPDDETDRGLYHFARGFLRDAGYVHYELSNFAKPGFESRHNTRYWKRAAYLGFGLGAHSFDGAARWNNTGDMKTYLMNPSAPKRENYEIIHADAALSEKIILGLRLMEGVAASLFAPYNDAADAFVRDGLLEYENSRIRLTPRGMDLANRVFSAFI
jgi:oxygen-independent coproporphyrinogen-3 oxidase